MHYFSLLLVPMLMLSTAVSAQNAPPVTSQAIDQWTPPAKSAAETTGFRSRTEKDSTSKKSHFTFKKKDHRSGYLNNPDKPWAEPPPSAHDKTSVMGGDRAWSNGRPPVDCAQTPMDATCH